MMMTTITMATMTTATIITATTTTEKEMVKRNTTNTHLSRVSGKAA
jgi:hypothetical protein